MSLLWRSFLLSIVGEAGEARMRLNDSRSDGEIELRCCRQRGGVGLLLEKKRMIVIVFKKKFQEDSQKDQEFG